MKLEFSVLEIRENDIIAKGIDYNIIIPKIEFEIGDIFYISEHGIEFIPKVRTKAEILKAKREAGILFDGL